MARILFTAADSRELNCAIEAVNLYKKRQNNSIEFEFLLTDIGTTSTSYRVTKKILESKAINNPYTLLFNIGIAGSFNLEEFPIGTTSIIEREYFADLGFESKESFQTLFEYGIYDKDLSPFTNGALCRTKLSSELEELLSNYKSATGVTVQKIVADLKKVEEIRRHFSADIESMEGAAIYYVSLQEKIPALEIRAISNAVGERDKSKWNIPLALESLTLCCKQIVNNITL